MLFVYINIRRWLFWELLAWFQRIFEPLKHPIGAKENGFDLDLTVNDLPAWVKGGGGTAFLVFLDDFSKHPFDVVAFGLFGKKQSVDDHVERFDGRIEDFIASEMEKSEVALHCNWHPRTYMFKSMDRKVNEKISVR